MLDGTKSSRVQECLYVAYFNFGRGENKGQLSECRKIILTFKTGLIHLRLSGHSFAGEQKENTTKILNELIRNSHNKGSDNMNGLQFLARL